MPPPPSFDYYQTLEVTKTANIEEITTSYRRFARVHHPDKDRENPEATAKFQQIQEAHENLSDPAKRARYDARSEGQRPLSGPCPAHHSYYDSGYYYEDSDHDMEQVEFKELLSQFFFTSHKFQGGGTDHGFGRSYAGMRENEYRQREEEYLRAKRAEKEEEERLDAIAAEQRKKFTAEKLARDKLAREKQEAVEKARKAEEEKKRAAELKILKEATAEQEKRWTVLGAKTTAEKQATCLHLEFWPKEQQTKKFKCGCCKQKRGPMAFKCPLCVMLSCQGCISKMTKKPA